MITGPDKPWLQTAVYIPICLPFAGERNLDKLVIKPRNLMRKVVPNPRRRVEPFVNLGKSAVSSCELGFSC